MPVGHHFGIILGSFFGGFGHQNQKKPVKSPPRTQAEKTPVFRTHFFPEFCAPERVLDDSGRCGTRQKWARRNDTSEMAKPNTARVWISFITRQDPGGVRRISNSIAPRIPPRPPCILSCTGALRHGCIGNARRDWKYCRKLKQILKKNVQKQMQKIPRIFTRIHGKSMKFSKKSSQKVSWGSQVVKIGLKGGQGTAKGRPRGSKVAQGGPKGATDGAKRGPREAKWGPWGRKEVKSKQK